MASYQNSFDPPPRPEERSKGRPTGVYLQYLDSGRHMAPSGMASHKERGIAPRAAQPGPRHGVNKSSGRQPYIPRLSSREPVQHPDPDWMSRTTSSYGIRRPTAPSRQTPGDPSLNHKSSRNVLRRKPSSIGQRVETPQHGLRSEYPDSSTPQPGSHPNDQQYIQTPPHSDQPFDLDTRQPMLRDVDGVAPIIPELDRYRVVGDPKGYQQDMYSVHIPHNLATEDLPPPTPINSAMSGHSRYSGYSGNSGNSAFSAYSGYSASPSTRYSESPGAYSRDTTPTSISSQSPSIVAPLRITPRLRQNSPISTRPPLTRRRAGSAPNEAEAVAAGLDMRGLPSLRESLTSSSSNSTVKESDKATGTAKGKKKKRLSPMPPSPPPRKSSQKFKKSRSDGGEEEEEDASPSKTSRSPARPVMATPPSFSPVKQSLTKPTRSVTKKMPPARPSREGTPNLEAQLEEARTIIQSNLPSRQFSHERRPSDGSITVGPQLLGQPEASPHPSMSRLPTRNYSPSPVQQLRSEPVPAPSGLGIIPDLRPDDNPSYQQRQIPASSSPSPSTATPKHRFGFFSRRNKVEPEAAKPTRKETAAGRGPAAGTGHEGYGRYAFRGRDRSHSAASSSQDSLNSARTHDPFLLERMSPVVIAGGGEVVQNRNTSLDLTRSESSQSLRTTGPSFESKTSISQASARSNLSKEVSRTTLWPSALPRSGVDEGSASPVSKGVYTSESSDNENFGHKPSLAFRRSINRLQSPDQGLLRLPKPLELPDGRSSPGTSSQATSLRSDDTRSDVRQALVPQTSQAGPKKLSKLTKRPRSPRKWNFFQRSQTSARSKPQSGAVVPVVVALTPPKTIPYYAMIDSSEQEDDAAMDMEEILREAEVLDFSNPKAGSPAPSSISKELSPTEALHHPSQVLDPTQSANSPSQLDALASAPLIAEVIERTAKEEDRERIPARPSRLLQVGRIPRVVTARPQQTSPKSFSRPFARVSTIQPLPNLTTVDHQSIAAGPSPDRSPSPQHLIESTSATTLAESGQTESLDLQKPFLVISPRKNSEATTSSSSGAMSFAGTTAVVPEPDAALEEDEIWDEYDDLLYDEDIKVPQSATSSHGIPFQYENFQSRAADRESNEKKEEPAGFNVPIILEKESNGELQRLELTSSSVYSPDLSLHVKNALGGLPSPMTPMSFTDFISGYGDRNNSVILGSGGSKRRSSPHSPRNSRPSSAHSRSGSLGERARQSSDSRLMTIAEQAHESPIAQVNLRVGSMTVSKWLSFGHVLFSPAREEVLLADDPTRHHSILVIDGLGNDDWAFYAAETYPSATFYNLSPSPSSDGKVSHSASLPQAPSNHRQVQYNSNLDKFPFPRDTFTAVVLRFPPASPDNVFRNLIAESKRVLKPAGYLEMSILDLDMMNMGNQTRRAVRGLKVRLSVADPSISLASAADTVLRMVGKRGFHDIKSCKVNVPVASTVSAGPKPDGEADGEEKDISLAEMMKDESSVGDAGITKMVAKVGRWWYTRSYEMAVLPNGDTSRSMFADAALLRECEKWNTNFKLLVCHAQKPVVPRRRTASV